MRHVFSSSFALTTLFLLLVAAPARAERFEPFIQRARAGVQQEVAAANAEAGRLFAEATAAEDAGNLEQAKAAYEQAQVLLPSSPHPVRRLCGVKLQLGWREAALADCRAALQIKRDAPQLQALAGTLMFGSPTDADRREAHALIEQAAALDDKDPLLFALLCQTSMATDNRAGLSRCVSALQRLSPEEGMTHMFAAVLAAIEERWSDAHAALDRAEANGMPAADIADLRAKIDHAQPAYDKWLPVAGWVLAGWLAALVTLVLAGIVLSSMTMRAAYGLPPERTGKAHGSAATLRRVYRFVIGATCVFYYLSIPIMLAAVLIAGGGSIYFFLAIGQIPIKLVLIIVAVVGITLWATLKSFFVKVKDEDPGTRLDLAAHPKLDALLGEVSAKVGTDKVDTVFLTAGTDIAVFERGGFLQQIRGKRSERCLILGAGALQGMRLLDLKAVLAHEYGHFQNEDTAGGGFALKVRRSVLHLAMGLAQGGAATWYNPAWWMVKGFFIVFLRISQGASRLQEILADRWAAFSYGAEAFERGLTHVIRSAVRFPAHADATLKEAILQKVEVKNLYRHDPETPPDPSAIEEAVTEALNREPSAYDSHPAPKVRFELVRNLDAPIPEGEDTEAEAWSVFSNRKRLERELTKEVIANVRLGLED